MEATKTIALFLGDNDAVYRHLCDTASPELEIRALPTDTSHEKLRAILLSLEPSLTFVDERHPQIRELLTNMLEWQAPSSVIVFGDGNDDFEALAGLEVHAAINPLEMAPGILLQMIATAAHTSNLKRQISLLSNTRTPVVAAPAGADLINSGHAIKSLGRLVGRMRQEGRLHDGITECLVEVFRLTRCALFWRSPEGIFTLASSHRALEQAKSTSFSAEGPLMGWMEANPQIIHAGNVLEMVQTTAGQETRLLLESVGGELIAPLIGGSGRLDGVVVLGPRMVGRHFSSEDISLLSDILSFFADLGESEEEAKALRRERDFLNELSDSINFTAIVLGEDGTVLWRNRGNLNERVPSQIASIAKSIFNGETVASEPVTVRDKVFRVSGQMRPGKKVLLLIEDVTEQFHAWEHAQETQRASIVSELSTILSHLIRNPLVSLSTFFQLLPARRNDPDFFATMGDLARRDVQTIHRVVAEIEDFANPLNAGRESVSPDLLIDQAINSRQAVAGARNIRIDRTVEENLPAIAVDRGHFVSCLTQVLENAIDASPEGQTVAINARREGETLVIAITDAGRGFKAAELSKAFLPFFSTKAQNLGLGLPLARRTLNAHGGKIDIRSSEGHTEVTLSVPFQTAPAVRTQPQHPQAT